MAGGLHFDSLADLPPNIQKQVAGKLLQVKKTKPVAGQAPEPEEKGNSQKNTEPKYHNVETVVHDIKFKSKKEANRYIYLKWLLDKGIIRDLKLQKQYTLQESFITARGERIRAIRYDTDFTYKIDSAGYDLVARGVAYDDVEYWRAAIAEHGPGVEIIEDTKSRPTRTQKYHQNF